MSCNAPINITTTGSEGTCDLKCDYSYDYKDSNTVLLNSGNHIQLTYDMSPSAPVRYNSDDYQVREVRMYFPSIHKYNGVTAAGEILIIHGSGGRNLIVSIPIVENNTESKASRFLDQIADYISKFAPNITDTASLGSSIWNLNDWIPQKKYYSYSGTAPYSPCMSGYDYVVFNKADGATVSISSQALNNIKKFITSGGIRTRENKYFISKNIAKQGLTDTGDDIYISCSPTSISEEHELVSEKNENNKKSENLFSELGRFMKKTNFLNNPLISIIIAALVMVGIFKIGKLVFGKIGEKTGGGNSVERLQVNNT